MSRLPDSSHLFATNAAFIEELYERYYQDPNSVDSSWKSFFQSTGDDIEALLKEHRGASWAPRGKRVLGVVDPEEKAAPKEQAKDASKGKPSGDVLALMDRFRAEKLLDAYRRFGHLLTQLDPLGLEPEKTHPELDPFAQGFSESDLDRPLALNGLLGLNAATLRELLGHLRALYGNHIGVEVSHLESLSEREWLFAKFDQNQGSASFSASEKQVILRDLVELEGFERFLHVKYQGVKRFSEEGGESAIFSMEEVIRASAKLGVSDVVIGTAHRGRMNVLTKIMRRSYASIMTEFQGKPSTYTDDLDVSGDVKYHLGASIDRTIEGKSVHLSLTANPSHLETVNPVTVGKVRAKQDQLEDQERRRVMGLLVHGDAAFAGQGVVPETLAMSRLDGYKTGGTVHIIINNQVGFTANPWEGRSTRYASDIAKGVDIPVFHVNGDDSEAVAYVSRVAAEYRHAFQKDVVIDVVGYRKYGHNESDEPSFTQPVMYRAVNAQKSTLALYAEQLAREGVVSAEATKALQEDFKQFLEGEYKAAASYKVNETEWLKGKWEGIAAPETNDLTSPKTGVSEKKLKAIAEALAQVPQGFALNSKLERFQEARKQVAETGQNIDWGMGEALAFGSLLLEGFPVRLSGQDCMRGTFSHRHSGLVDQNSNVRYYPLNHLASEQARYEVINSHLSEYAVMGFEYGYSLAEPNALVLWEGQFGDFANGAQIIIDQCISSGESKWLRLSGLVLLLPHGQEGQGPEHSSARLERFLQLCAEENMIVANCTTPANYFHILRRQLHQKARKPLVLMTPKSLLRHKRVISSFADMKEGTRFLPVIGESEKLVADSKVRRVVLCSGKVYYELLEEREAKKIQDVALVRLEQFYPFPEAELAKVLSGYTNAEVVWCQEEPKNMGAWSFLAPRLQELLAGMKRDSVIRYVGRPESASPAPGYAKFFQARQRELVEAAFLDAKPVAKKRFL